MVVRIISALVALPLLIFVVLKGGLYLEVAVALISVIGMYEFYNALSKKFSPLKWPSIATLLGLQYLYRSGEFFALQGLLAFYIIGVLMTYVVSKKMKIQDAALSVLGLVYIGFFLYHVILFTKMDHGYMLGYIFIVSWGADTGAYFVGKAIGKRKLSPIISPNKSIEGAVGGVVTAMVLSGLWSAYFDVSMVVPSILIAIVGSLTSIMGDLTASKIKREIDIKDYGKIMPGHGGIMDRFDSLILVTPLVYYLLNISLKLLG